MSIMYTKKVLEHFKNPRNVGVIEDANAVATEGSIACGDMITIYLKINEQKVIEDIKFKSYGCASNIATASILTEMVKGKSINEAKKIKYENITNELGGLPSQKVHCSVLAEKTLKSAIKKYEKNK